MGILDLDPSMMNMDMGNIITQTAIWGGMLLWFAIFMVLVYYLVNWRKYNIPMDIYEPVGDVVSYSHTTKGKEVVKHGITKYEIRTFMGLIFKDKKEFFLNPSHTFKIPSKGKIGYRFNLLKMGWNAYMPRRINVYTNIFDRFAQSLKGGLGVKGELKPGKPTKEVLIEKKEYSYTYIAMPKEEIPADFEIMPQNLLPHLAKSLKENVDMFQEKKWWEDYLLPFSIMLLIIFQIILMGWMFDKVGGVGGACMQAKDSIIGTLSQRVA